MKWIPDNFKGLVASFVVICSFAYFFFVSARTIKADPQIIIAIVAAMQNVLNYYFGSSQGANKKDQIISEMTTSTPPATTNTGDINITQTKPNESSTN